jgi:hypothetical protein
MVEASGALTVQDSHCTPTRLCSTEHGKLVLFLSSPAVSCCSVPTLHQFSRVETVTVRCTVYVLLMNPPRLHLCLSAITPAGQHATTSQPIIASCLKSPGLKPTETGRCTSTTITDTDIALARQPPHVFPRQLALCGEPRHFHVKTTYPSTLRQDHGTRK